MKLYTLCTVGIICTMCVGNSANAQTICGKIYGQAEIENSVFLPYGAPSAYCSTSSNSTNPSYITQFNTNYDWACVEYDNIISDGVPHLFMTNCNITGYYCGQESYYNGHGCTPCPDNTVALEYDGYHANTECPYTLCKADYFYVPQVSKCFPCDELTSNPRAAMHKENYCLCKQGYYWADTTCIECPYNGVSIEQAASPIQISECFLPGGSFFDDTGNGVITPNDAKCYWNN